MSETVIVGQKDKFDNSMRNLDFLVVSAIDEGFAAGIV